MMRYWLGLGAVALLLACALVFARAATGNIPTTRGEAHMEMTLHAAEQPGDRARAGAILAAAREVMALYPTVEDAERAGFKKFLPGVPLPVEHYTNRAYAIKALFGHFDPTHPTSIIFTRKGGVLTIAGVMYTASNLADRDALNARVPLSFGTWHRHVDFCKARNGGLLLDVTTAGACAAAGGTFVPRVFGWMVHVWPNEKTEAQIWAVDMHGAMAGMPDGM